jgi:hypothetical protein
MCTIRADERHPSFFTGGKESEDGELAVTGVEVAGRGGGACGVP